VPAFYSFEIIEDRTHKDIFKILFDNSVFRIIHKEINGFALQMSKKDKKRSSETKMSALW
jgi:hypothetical protein